MKFLVSTFTFQRAEVFRRRGGPLRDCASVHDRTQSNQKFFCVCVYVYGCVFTGIV